MHKKRVYSWVGLVLAGAGCLAYYSTHGTDAALGAAPTRAASTASAMRAQSSRGAAAREAAPEAAPDLADGTDGASATGQDAGERFPNTPIGRALNKHMLILVDVSPGADARKAESLAELRKHAKEASAALLDAYHNANPDDEFGRWLLSLTLGELGSDEAYRGLTEIANSGVREGLKDSDHDGNALANESAIRQNATGGLASLAHGGNADAEADLMSLALNPPSGDDAVRIVAIKGYLAAGEDYAARVAALKAQLPSQYHDVVTLTVTQPEEPTAPANLHASR